MRQIITDLDEIKRRTEQEEQENIRFRQFLKYRLRWSDRRLDEEVHRIAQEVEQRIDCTQCANCCRVLEISLQEEDIDRLALRFGLSFTETEARFAASGTHCPRAFAASPCTFLKHNRCTVYADRPCDCREYPHLDKPDFRLRMWQLLANAENCPIVFNTLQWMKEMFWRSRTGESA